MTGKRFLLFMVAATTSVVLGAGAPATAAAAGSFRITLDPPASELAATGNPDSHKQLTEVTVEALASDGTRQPNAIIDLTLTAPRFGNLVRSDIPRIEGKELLHTRFLAPEGVYRFEYTWPIRGSYELDLRAEPAPGSKATFTPFADQQTIRVPERSSELTRLMLYLAVLFAVGALGTFVLVRAHHRRSVWAAVGRAAPGGRGGGRFPAAQLGLLGVVVVGMVAFLAVEQAKDSGADRKAASYRGAAEGAAGTAESGATRLRYQLSRSNDDGISVQTLLTTSGVVEDTETGQPLPGAALRFEAVDLEGGEVVFSAEGVTPDGRFSWDHDFWDGIDYDVKLTVLPGTSGRSFDPFTKTLEVAVSPMSPPLDVKLVGMAYSLGAFVAGMAIVLAVTRRRWRGGATAVPALGAQAV